MKKAAFKQSVDDFINELRGEMKEASARVKSAMNAGDDTSHPSGSKDNGTEYASTGSHSADLTSQVKKLVGDEAVESASEASTSDKQDSVAEYGDTVGKGEIPSAQDKLPDPGTSLSEAKTAEFANLSYEDARDRTVKLANAMLALVIADKDEASAPASKEAGKKEAGSKKVSSPAVTAEPAAPTDKEAAAGEDEGPALIDYVAQQVDTQLKMAYTLADMLAAEIAVQKAALQKRAEEGSDEGGEERSEGGEEKKEEKESPSPSAPVEETSDEMAAVSADPTEEIFNSLLQSPDAGAAAGAGLDAGLDAGAAPAGPGAAGLPGGDAAAAMPPDLSGGMGAGDAGMGADPMAAAAGGLGAGGGAMSQDEALQELIMALLESGVTPDQLAGASPQGEKLAADIRTMKKAGKFKIQEAKTATQRKLRDRFKNYLLEVVKD